MLDIAILKQCQGAINEINVYVLQLLFFFFGIIVKLVGGKVGKVAFNFGYLRKKIYDCNAGLLLAPAVGFGLALKNFLLFSPFQT